MRILIIEDEKKLALMIKRGLINEGYNVECVFDGETGEIAAETGNFDLILLDLMLPKKDGLEVCKYLRKKGLSTPVLMLTAKDSTANKITGLDYGADDYVVKPFSFEELVARIKALLRRPSIIVPEILQAGNIKLNTKTREVTHNKRVINLTKKEFSLLECFLRNPNQVLTREQILENLWGWDYEGFSNVVDAHIKNLRKKIDRCQKGSLIETIQGTGYRLKG
jgi:DNA-binding response OmpR family regulator